jgi:DNA-binding winged helix-turn-helix (wHTH) protein/Flp pilus assembly protein TadD
VWQNLPLPPTRYSFGPFELDGGAYRLLRDGTPVPLSPKLVEVLIHLVSNQGALVTKDALFAAVWPDVVVTDNALTQAISDLRHALGDRASAPQFIQTVARRGYRFIAHARPIDEPAPVPAIPVRAARETSSLDAFQAFSDGRLKLESLDAAQIRSAVEDFTRAATLDARYPAPHVGLANARFYEYELSRARNTPDRALLAAAVDHARRAIELDRDYAEAHATLSFLLVSAGRAEEALTTARHAVRLDPSNWAHHFRLGHAAWGSERLAALTTALDLYSEFAYGHFEIAMVHIARGDFDRAEHALREGVIVQDRQAGRRERFPARGLHWLLGLVRLARGDTTEATLEFERETASGGQLYAPEFAMNAFDGLGFTALVRGDAAAAEKNFRHALELFPAHARSHVGLAVALADAGKAEEADLERTRARQAIADLARGGRVAYACLTEAFERVAAGAPEEALDALERLLKVEANLFTGWTVPVEPLLRPLESHARFGRILATVAERAK